jgi:hypothetical protein
MDDEKQPAVQNNNPYLCQYSPPPPPTAAPPVPVDNVVWWTVAWVFLLLVFVAIALLRNKPIAYADYEFGVRVAAVILVIVAIVGLCVALKNVGPDAKPWYTVGKGFLVALVLFWGLFPPTWFFLEYWLFDNGIFQMPEYLQKEWDSLVGSDKDKRDLVKAFELKAKYLAASTKAYSDLALKIWVAVGAGLATAIGLAKKG